MMAALPLRIAILNRFAPPDGAPTARAAAELARDLAAALPRAEITLYASEARYASDPAPPAEPDWPTRRVPSLYAGKWPPARLLASLIEGHALARLAAREADVVISLTDPPLLSLWAGPACRRRGRRWIEWSLDRYPDFFAAAGLVGEGNPLYRLLVRRDAALRPDAVIGLGAGQLHHLAGRRGPLPPAVILPVGLVPPPTEPAPEPDPGSPLTLVYAGTLGEAHGPEPLAALVGRADPARFRFLFAARGRHAAGLRRRLAGHPAVSWRDRLATADLARADAHLVSLSPRALHLSVPSKAVSAVALGRPFLFAGPAEADSWRELGEAGWLIPHRSGGLADAAAIDAALSGLADPAARSARAAAARRLARELQERRTGAISALAAMIAAW
ncbi:MAG: hypothetical protein WCJ64_15465 [Rhodospirillaceae bacterium]